MYITFKNLNIKILQKDLETKNYFIEQLLLSFFL